MKDTLKAAVKSRTMNFGSLLVIAGLLEQHSDAITRLVPEQYDGLAISVIGVVVWGLRFVTTTPLVNSANSADNSSTNQQG